MDSENTRRKGIVFKEEYFGDKLDTPGLRNNFGGKRPE